MLEGQVDSSLPGPSTNGSATENDLVPLPVADFDPDAFMEEAEEPVEAAPDHEVNVSEPGDELPHGLGSEVAPQVDPRIEDQSNEHGALGHPEDGPLAAPMNTDGATHGETDTAEFYRDIMQVLQSEERPEREENGSESAAIAAQTEEPKSVLSSPLSDVPSLPNEPLEFPEPPMVEAGSSRLPIITSKPSIPPNGHVTASASQDMDTLISNQTAHERPQRPVRGKRDQKTVKGEDDLWSMDGSQAEGSSSTSRSKAKAIKVEEDVTEEESEEAEGSGKGKKRKRGKGGKGNLASAKSRKLLDQVLGIERGEQAPAKVAPRAKAMTESQLRTLLKGKTKEVQFGMCQRDRYAPWGKCTQCIAKLGGDSCRFREFRTFPIDPETTEITGQPWFESTEWKEAMTPLPKIFNIAMQEEHIARIERTVAPLLLPLISREVRHVVNQKAVKRGMDAAIHRSVCDFCASTIFGGWFMCKKCGRDFCLVCERYFADSMETMAKSPWSLPDAARPRLLRCNNALSFQKTKAEGKTPQFHFRPDLQPISRWTEDELKEHWLSLADFVLEGEGGLNEKLTALGVGHAGEEAIEALRTWLDSRPPESSSSQLNGSLTSTEEVEKLYTKITNTQAEPIADPAGLENHSRRFLKIDLNDLNNDKFDVLWARGEPIMVDKVEEGFKMSWTPDDFIERFGQQVAVVVDCQTGVDKFMKVEAFFSYFKDRESRGEKILKLKDWPETDDFANTHPALYDDFCDALPVPDFTRREGVLNLYAHFPPGPTRPDIGPKMYNAFEAFDGPKGKGSTCLHMDVADAVNVMLYASSRSDGQPGCAVWDLFRAEDADKIRLFLKKKYDQTHVFTDPIHSQLFYLDSDLRKELFERHGVVSWRIYQYPGQAVFIPAGCAHQVCNLADCIKIAVDFVSTHNVARCQQLTQDFRTENFVINWKCDVLQLYNVLWYAWLNTREIRQQWRRDAAADKAAAESRAAHLQALANGEPLDDAARPALGARLGSGFLTAQVSSARDEGMASGGSAVIPDDPGKTAETRDIGMDQEGQGPYEEPEPVEVREGTINGVAIPVDPSKAIPQEDKPDPRPETGLHQNVDETGDLRAVVRRELGQKLLQATLGLVEQPPPAEARIPSSASRWAGAGPKFAPPKIAKPSKSSKGGSKGTKMNDVVSAIKQELKQQPTAQLQSEVVLEGPPTVLDGQAL